MKKASTDPVNLQGHMCHPNCSCPHQQERRDLYWALRTRVLTTAEMERVRQIGFSLVIELMSPYREADKTKEFNDALFRQFEMRKVG